MCLHDAVCNIPLNLIGNMAAFSKNMFGPLTPTQESRLYVRA